MLNLALGVLITWRITSMLVNEDGPADIFARLRDWLGVRYGEVSQPYGTNGVANALCCVWCTSIWVGWVMALIFVRHDAFFVGLAYSAGTIIVDKWVKR